MTGGVSSTRLQWRTLRDDLDHEAQTCIDEQITLILHPYKNIAAPCGRRNQPNTGSCIEL
jgi:hypothetical protein